MANFKVPRHVAFVAALPLNASGKVLNRRAAPRWRNAASRSDDAIYDELTRYGAMT